MANLVYERWVGEPLYNKVLNHKEKQILAKSREGYVSRYDDIVVKERKVNAFGSELNNVAVRREYEIGLLANKYPYLVKTLGYSEIENNGVVGSYLFFEYVKGKPLLHYLNQRIDLDIIYSQIFTQLKELQEMIKFTHYDLHNMNVIVEALDNKKYKITFIDLGNSHIEGIESMMCEASMIYPSVAPGIFDPLHDYMRILGSFMNSLKPNKGIKKLLQINNFDVHGFPILEIYYEMGDLVGDFYFFAATSDDIKVYSTKDVHSKYAKVKINHLLKNNPSLYEKLESKVELEEYKDLEIANSYFFTPNDVKEWIILLGKAMASDKLLMIEAYYHTAEEVHNIAMRYAKTLKNCF